MRPMLEDRAEAADGGLCDRCRRVLAEMGADPSREPVLSQRTLYRSAYLLVSVAILFLDQWSKGVVTRAFGPHESREVLGQFFLLTFVRNSGAAFGLFANFDPCSSRFSSTASPWRRFSPSAFTRSGRTSRACAFRWASLSCSEARSGISSTASGSATSWISCSSASAAITGRRSTSRTPRSASAWGCSHSTCSGRRPRSRRRRAAS